MKKRSQWVMVGLFLSLALMVGQAHQVQSQEKYPARSIEIIVPFGPGGSTDLNSRVIAAYLTKRWKVPVNVINKPGGEHGPSLFRSLWGDTGRLHHSQRQPDKRFDGGSGGCKEPAL
jgi:tripartite-type tricarboxylate transporter receptor subunit TctC